LGLGFSVGDVTMRRCFWIFDQFYLAMGTNSMSHFFGSKLFSKLGNHPRL